MSLYILDTDILSLIQQDSRVVIDRVEKATAEGHTVGLLIVSVEEQFYGWLKELSAARSVTEFAKASRSLTRAVRLWGRFQISPETESSRTMLQQLVRLKLNVGKNDLRIASVVFDLGAILVTHNLVDYRRIPGLRFEDWASP